MFKKSKIKIPAWGLALLIGFLVPQIALAGIPQVSSPIKTPVKWLTGDKSDKTMLPTGLLIETELFLKTKKKVDHSVFVAQRTVREYDEEIYNLKRERNRKYGIVWPIIFMGVGASLLLTSLYVFAGSMASVADMTTAMLLSGLFFVPGIILFIIGITRLFRNLKRRKRFNRRIRILKERRSSLMGGRGFRDRRRVPPQDGDPDGPPPPGGEGFISSVPIFEFSF